MNIIEELRWRGLIHEITPETEEHLKEHKVSVYLGVDPTGDSMHIGNLVPVMMLVNLQRAAYPMHWQRNFTGYVGDPSGKDKERQLLSEDHRRVQGIASSLSIS